LIITDGSDVTTSPEYFVQVKSFVFLRLSNPDTSCSYEMIADIDQTELGNNNVYTWKQETTLLNSSV
jgi:hypothetical protein